MENISNCPNCQTNEHIKVRVECPPIPIRDFDYVIYCTNCYDCDTDDHGEYFSDNLVCYGKNEKEAIENWNERSKDLEDEK